MKKKEKRMILIIVLIGIVILVGLFFLTRRNKQESSEQGNQSENTIKEEFVKNLDDGTKLNISSKLSETKTFQGISFGDIQLTNKDNETMLIATASNNSGSDTEAKLINIILFDKNGKEIGKVPGRIIPLKAGDSKQFSAATTLDLANAYDFKIEAQ